MHFRWWNWLQILRIPYQKITRPTPPSRVQSVSNEHSRKGLWCRTDALDLGLLTILDKCLLLLQMEYSALQMVN